jgi:hypothetical protein
MLAFVTNQDSSFKFDKMTKDQAEQFAEEVGRAPIDFELKRFDTRKDLLDYV